MKTIRIISVVILLSTVLVNNAKASERAGIAHDIAIHITFQQAIQDAGLVAAMHNQLNGGYLGGPAGRYITLAVTYNNHLYLITGTVEQLTVFFNSFGFKADPRNPNISKLIYLKPNVTL